ncbi:MAG: hypothetical protein WEC79_03410, partial [Thermomicrobiales bacterium]
MATWSVLELIDGWVRETNSPELTFDRDAVRLFHDVNLHGQSVLRWMRAEDGRKLLISDLTRGEEIFLRQRLTDPGSIARQPSIAGSVTVRLLSPADLDAVLNVFTMRLAGTPIVPASEFSGRWGEFIYWAGRF